MPLLKFVKTKKNYPQELEGNEYEFLGRLMRIDEMRRTTAVSFILGVGILLSMMAISNPIPTVPLVMDCMVLGVAATLFIANEYREHQLNLEIDQNDFRKRKARGRELEAKMRGMTPDMIKSTLNEALVNFSNRGSEERAKFKNCAAIKFCLEGQHSPFVTFAEEILEALPRRAEPQDLVNIFNSCYSLLPTSEIGKTIRNVDPNFLQRRMNFFSKEIHSDYKALGKIEDARASQVMLLGSIFALINHPEKFPLSAELVEKISEIKTRHPEIGEMATDYFFELFHDLKVEDGGVALPAVLAFSMTQNGHCDFEQIKSAKKESAEKEVMLLGAQRLFGGSVKNRDGKAREK